VSAAWPVLDGFAGRNGHADEVIFLGIVVLVLMALGYVARHRK
jgi:hypothetical protein